MRLTLRRKPLAAACLLALLLAGCQSSQPAPVSTLPPKGKPIDSTPQPAATALASPTSASVTSSSATNPVAGGTRPLPTDPAERAKLANDVPAPEGKGKFKAVSFAQLSSFPYETDDQGRLTPRCKIPAAIRDLDEEPVALAGFMIPIEFKEDKVSGLILVRNQLLCCFGQQPKLNEWVYVNANPPVAAVTDTPVTLYGKFHARPDFEGEQILSLYRMEAEQMEVPR